MTNTTTPTYPTIQSMFDVMWQVFVVEKAPQCYLERDGETAGACQYYLPNTAGCAVGCLLPVELAKRLPKGGIRTLQDAAASDEELAAALTQVFGSAFMEDDAELIRFLVDAQNAHDNWAGEGKFADHMERKLRGITRIHKLRVP